MIFLQNIEVPAPRQVPTNPNDGDLYAGLCGGDIECETYHLGSGVILRPTYAHLMAPFILAFQRPSRPGVHHPAPWRTGPIGLAFDIEAEICIPRTFEPEDWFDRLNTAWWIVALIRLQASTMFRVPVISSVPFTFLSDSESAQMRPMEIASRQVVPTRDTPKPLTSVEMDWIRINWVDGGRLMATNDNFNAAFQALDQCVWTPLPSLSLVQVWGAFERLFTTVRHKKTYQLTRRISGYLKPPGVERDELATRIVELYDSRSSVAHGSQMTELDALCDSYALLREAIVNMIERRHVPTDEELNDLGPV